MGKGLLSQWRRRIAARGVAGAVLFTVPVAVAGTIGFSGGFAGLGEGLSSLASGPDAEAQVGGTSGGDNARSPVESIFFAVTEAATGAAPGGGGGDGASGGGEDVAGSEESGGAPVAPLLGGGGDPGGGTDGGGGDPGGGGGTGGDLPGSGDLPGGGGPAGPVVDQVGEAVGGLSNP
jgi:hypothetical protein